MTIYNRRCNNNKKSKDMFNLKIKTLLRFFIFLLVFSLLLFNSFCVFAGSNPYTPTAPYGNSTGEINIEYEYLIYTEEVGSYWLFDWGDGNFSEWIEVGPSDNYISQKHSWLEYGVYQVRVKHMNIYLTESAWSPPLTVSIVVSPDLDGDGWNNEIEEAYGKNPEDSKSYPLDTDGDGSPDDDSFDGNYTGDLDDDNDGLSDIIEQTLGLNPKDFSDVERLFIEANTYFIIDKDGNGNKDTLYNFKTKIQTKTSLEHGKLYLDINGDGSWDYKYINGVVSIYKAPFPWLYIIIAIIAAVLIVIFVLFKKGIIFLYQEEYVVEE